jgi:hypothetical protein
MFQSLPPNYAAFVMFSTAILVWGLLAYLLAKPKNADYR